VCALFENPGKKGKIQTTKEVEEDEERVVEENE